MLFERRIYLSPLSRLPAMLLWPSVSSYWNLQDCCISHHSIDAFKVQRVFRRQQHEARFMGYLSSDIKQLTAEQWSSSREATWDVCLGARNHLPKSMFDEQWLVIRGPVLVQAVDIRDIGISRAAQLEGSDRHSNTDRVSNARKEGGSRRRVNYNLDMDEDDNGHQGGSSTNSRGKGLRKIVFEDSAGTRAYGLEYSPIRALVDLQLGGKLLLSSVGARRGVLLLQPENTKILGGSVSAWNENRDEILTNQLSKELQEFAATR
jgi:hypothetical protein